MTDFADLNSLELDLKYHPTTRKQRERFERVTMKQGFMYTSVMRICTEIIGRRITSVGQLTYVELDGIMERFKQREFIGRERR